MVTEICALTDSTDSIVSLLVGVLFSSICNPNVSKHPPLSPPSPLLLLPSLEVPTILLTFEWPSGRIEKPEGKRGITEESPPLIKMSKDCESIGEYTTIEPELSVHESCRYRLLPSFPFGFTA